MYFPVNKYDFLTFDINKLPAKYNTSRKQWQTLKLDLANLNFASNSL